MKAAGRLIAVVLAGILYSGLSRADDPPPIVAGIKQGAQLDKECLKLNVVNAIGACRVRETGIERPLPIMLGFYFHMWFSDALLAELYRGKKPELADKFEQLADAEFSAVIEYETKLRVPPGDLCLMVEVNCETVARYHDQWRQRLKQKGAAARPSPGRSRVAAA